MDIKIEIGKIRNKSFQKLIRFHILIVKKFPQRDIGDLTVKDLESIYIKLGLKRRNAYNYLKTLKILLQ